MPRSLKRHRPWHIDSFDHGQSHIVLRLCVVVLVNVTKVMSAAMVLAVHVAQDLSWHADDRGVDMGGTGNGFGVPASLMERQLVFSFSAEGSL